MLIGDSSSTQNDHRLRRLAAEERARVDRATQESAVREGLARQAGEAPNAEEIDRFRSLMQSRGDDTRTPGRTQNPSGQDPRAARQEGGAKSESSVTPQSMRVPVEAQSAADRFRAALLRAFDAPEQKPSTSTKDDAPATPQKDTRSADGADAKSSKQAAAAQLADRGGDRAQQTGASRTDAAPEDASMSKAPADGKQDDRRESVRGTKDKTPSAEQIARKAAHGDAEVVQAARAAHVDDDTDDGSGQDASFSSMAGGSSPSMPPAEAVMQPQAQPQAQPADVPQQAAQAQAFAPALSELLQKHVRQMLVTDPRSARGGSREVLLRMQNEALPGTDLWLTQTEDGWRLRADVSSRDAYDTLLEFQDELVQRFADSSLGQLTIEPVFHGSPNPGFDNRPALQRNA